MLQIDTILFATDFSESSEHAFAYALSLAEKYGARLLVMHVINEPVDLRGFYVPHISFEKLEQEIEEGAQKIMEKFCRTHIQGFRNFDTCIVNGIPYEEIIKKAETEKAAMIVMGTQGRKGLDHLLFGSTAERVVRGAHCPVLTVHPQKEG